MNEEERELRTEYLGQYDELKVPIIVDILADHGITAWPKLALEQNQNTVSLWATYEKGEVLVEAGKAEEARAIIERELPEHMAAIEASMDVMEHEGDPDGPGKGESRSE